MGDRSCRRREWIGGITEKNIPNLPPNSIVVLDNSRYHSTQINKPPTSVATKDVIGQWLLDHNIPFEEKISLSYTIYYI